MHYCRLRVGKTDSVLLYTFVFGNLREHHVLLQTLCGGQSQHAELPSLVPGLTAELRASEESLRQRWGAGIPGETAGKSAHVYV